MHMFTLARIRRATVVIAAALALVGGVTITAAGSAAASPQDCGKSVLGNAAPFSLNGTQIGVFYIAWDSCAKQVYGEVRFDSTAKARGWDWDSPIYVSHHSDDQTREYVLGNGGAQFWTSPLMSIYTAPSSDRAYYAAFALRINHYAACWGSAGWDFGSGRQLGTTYATCDAS
jgi:hypothetical protein